MNVQTIIALASQLKALGFDEMGSVLLKRICFKPDNFFISSRSMKEKDQFGFEIYFERNNKDGDYLLKYYDAILQKEQPFLQKETTGIDIAELEQKMKGINWKSAFDVNEKKQWTVDNKASWENEATIESIIDDFRKLDRSEEGKSISNYLKVKYWSAIPGAETIAPFNSGRTKQEISQRFYFFEGQIGISVDEACRFLQNRWLEKQMQQKRKQVEEPGIETAEGTQSSNGSGLLRKRRMITTKRKLKTES